MMLWFASDFYMQFVYFRLGGRMLTTQNLGQLAMMHLVKHHIATGLSLHLPLILMDATIQPLATRLHTVYCCQQKWHTYVSKYVEVEINIYII